MHEGFPSRFAALVGIDHFEQRKDVFFQFDGLERDGMRKHGFEQAFRAGTHLFYAHHRLSHFDCHRYFFARNASGAPLAELYCFSEEFHGGSVVAGRRKELSGLAQRVHELVGGRDHSGIHLLVKLPCVYLLFHEHVEGLLPRAEYPGGEFHCEDVEPSEPVGILFQERFQHLEERLQLLFALLVVLEGEVYLREVEEEGYEQRAEFTVVEIGNSLIVFSADTVRSRASM